MFLSLFQISNPLFTDDIVCVSLPFRYIAPMYYLYLSLRYSLSFLWLRRDYGAWRGERIVHCTTAWCVMQQTSMSHPSRRVATCVPPQWRGKKPTFLFRLWFHIIQWLYFSSIWVHITLRFNSLFVFVNHTLARRLRFRFTCALFLRLTFVAWQILAFSPFSAMESEPSLLELLPEELIFAVIDRVPEAVHALKMVSLILTL